MAKVYLITDGRPLDRAIVCEICDTLREARRERPNYGADAQIWESDYKEDSGEFELEPEEDWRLVE